MLAGGLLGSVVIAMLIRAQPSNPDWVAGLALAFLAVGSFVLFISAMSEAKREMKPSCASLTTAVEYLGWYGTVHEFMFSSWTYANSFVTANGRKSVSGIRTLSGGRDSGSAAQQQGSPSGPYLLAVGGAVLLVLIIVAAATHGKNQASNSDSHSAPAVAAVIAAESASGVSGFRRYTNPRFGFSVLYPEGFVRGQEPQNGDGLSFTSPDGNAIVSVSGGYNGSDSTSHQLEQALADAKGTVTYRKLTPSWFVISWLNPETHSIGYQKTFVGPSSQNTLRFIYPADRKKQYDSVLRKIARSFHAGDLSNAQ